MKSSKLNFELQLPAFSEQPALVLQALTYHDALNPSFHLGLILTLPINMSALFHLTTAHCLQLHITGQRLSLPCYPVVLADQPCTCTQILPKVMVREHIKDRAGCTVQRGYYVTEVHGVEHSTVLLLICSRSEEILQHHEENGWHVRDDDHQSNALDRYEETSLSEAAFSFSSLLHEDDDKFNVSYDDHEDRGHEEGDEDDKRIEGLFPVVVFPVASESERVEEGAGFIRPLHENLGDEAEDGDDETEGYKLILRQSSLDGGRFPDQPQSVDRHDGDDDYLVQEQGLVDVVTEHAEVLAKYPPVGEECGKEGDVKEDRQEDIRQGQVP